MQVPNVSTEVGGICSTVVAIVEGARERLFVRMSTSVLFKASSLRSTVFAAIPFALIRFGTRVCQHMSLEVGSLGRTILTIFPIAFERFLASVPLSVGLKIAGVRSDEPTALGRAPKQPSRTRVDTIVLFEGFD
jgi:hypothetical protein